MRSTLVAGLASALLVVCCGAPPDGGTTAALRVLTSVVPDHLDPLGDPRMGSRNVFLAVFEPLIRVEPDGRLTPAIAERWVNPSPEVYEFRLRSGVRLHDGRLLEAGHVVAALQRARAAGSVVAGNLAEVDRIEARDPSTVTVTTRMPSAILLHALTAVPICLDGATPGRWVGTGPFRVLGFDPGEEVRLERFAEYWGARPAFDQVTFRRFASAEDLARRLGEPGSTVVLDAPRSAVDSARADPRWRLVSELSNSVSYLAFDLARDPTPGVRLDRNPFLDVRVRRAVRLALDVEPLLRLGASRARTPATQLAPHSVFGHDPGIAAVSRDLTAARSLLASAGLSGGFECSLDAPLGERTLAEDVARQLAAIGIRVEVRALPVGEFRARIDSGSSFFLYNWVLGQESGEALKNFFHTRDDARRLGIRNRTGYSNADVDRLVESAGQVTVAGQRLVLLQEAMRLLMADLPWVPLFVDRATRIVSRDVLLPLRADGMLALAEARTGAATEPSR